MKIVLATHNPGKIVELQKTLEVPGIEYIPVSDFDVKAPKETGNSFIENAILKMEDACGFTGYPAIADDSGLEIEALDGFPGIQSARCAGPNASDEDRAQYILEAMRGRTNRKARFMCAMAFGYIKGSVNICSHTLGTVDGEILDSPMGTPRPGVPYDSIFFHPHLKKTFAQMTEWEKNIVSHRAIACRKMKMYLYNFVKQLRT